MLWPRDAGLAQQLQQTAALPVPSVPQALGDTLPESQQTVQHQSLQGLCSMMQLSVVNQHAFSSAYWHHSAAGSKEHP